MIARSVLLAVVLGLATSAAWADGAPPRRVAVIVGANRAALGRTSLRYSYRDAQEIANVLTQVSEFAPDDVHVLEDPDPDAVLSALDHELQSLGSAAGETLLVFYYSGHADAAALYPGGKPLLFGKLRERLESPSATVRIGIIDACSGGGWTGAKGGRPGAPFAVDVPLQLSEEGSALIASSSGVESAHESEAILGSFFTHHLVAALRGAADPRGDGVVTLTDAFAYAKERTVRDTAGFAQPQHPSFSMNLRGRSDLPLARVTTSTTLVELRESEGPLQLVHLGTGLVVLEVPPGRRVLKLSVPPGRYLLIRRGPTGSYSREISVEPNRSVAVSEEELQLSGFPASAAKRLQRAVEAWPLAVNERPLTLLRGLAELEVGTLVGASDGRSFGTPLGVAPTARLGVTDWLTLSIGAPGGICIGSNGCAILSSDFAFRARFSLPSLGPLELAPGFAVGYDSGPQDVPLRASVTARLGRGGPLAILVTPEVDYLITTGGNHPKFWSYGVTGQLVLQPVERVAFDLGAPVRTNPFPIPNRKVMVKLAAGATFVVNHHLDLRAQLTFEDLLASGTAGPLDARTFGLFLFFRP